MGEKRVMLDNNNPDFHRSNYDWSSAADLKPLMYGGDRIYITLHLRRFWQGDRLGILIRLLYRKLHRSSFRL